MRGCAARPAEPERWRVDMSARDSQVSVYGALHDDKETDILAESGEDPYATRIRM